jgi:hypothetical protein
MVAQSSGTRSKHLVGLNWVSTEYLHKQGLLQQPPRYPEKVMTYPDISPLFPQKLEIEALGDLKQMNYETL